ncbi:MAG: hypothetical protein NZ772_14695 [Cyanobacteria bacterium]|nr:hypothetical protein [Cyanobacteriota bacterium]MDW8202619.1 hypothetical protein [Cyanobacteriota bacterium SKYGB_h_bin112]
MMTRTVSAIVTILTLVSSNYLAYAVPYESPIIVAQSVWRPFRDPNGKFTVLMPGDPKQQRQQQQTRLGNLDIYTFAVEQPGLSAHLVTYTDFPAESIQNVDPNKLLDSGRDEVLRRVQGSLLSESRISLNGAPGRELKIKAPGDLIIHSRIYMVNQRLYQLIVVAPASKAANLSGSIRGFFQSFRLL